MALRLNSLDEDFPEKFNALATASRGALDEVGPAVADIIKDVCANGFAAIADYTQRFDRVSIDPQTARIEKGEITAAANRIAPDLRDALQLAADRIFAFHERQLPKDIMYTDEVGASLGWRWTSVDAAGLYAPGGRAAYPSSVLMNAIPAKVAGVRRLVMCTPTPGGEITDAVLAAAHIADIDEIWRIGGAQAVAAMAHGADPIEPVDVIVGPGNAYVAEAKRQVFGVVGVDSIAGPSEILVVADADNPVGWTAADLLSQAEHDPSSQCILITDDAAYADAVVNEVGAQIAAHPRREIVHAAWQNNSAVIVVNDLLADAPRLVDRLAPEHLELAVAEPDVLFARIRHAGAVFLGRYAPEALGDYVAGPNHVLPTSGAARFASGLSVQNFMKRTTILQTDLAAFSALGPAAARLADAEGLPGHAGSIRRRLEDN